jgi:ribonuclease III
VKEEALQRCQEILGYTFDDPAILEKALTHSSIAPNRTDSNERLEFLGDVVLGLVVCEKLYRDHEDYQEGELTKIKSAVVSRRICAEVALGLGIPELLHIGKGFGRGGLPMSLAAAVLESVIGAIYIDGGLAPAQKFIVEHMEPQIDAVIENEHADNFKSLLQQYAQRRWNCTPAYELLDEKGPDHAKAFEVGVYCGGERFRSAWANNKKEAEQLAARAALEELGLVESDQSEDGGCGDGNEGGEEDIPLAFED